MVARSNQQAKLKLAMAAGGGTIFIFLAVVGGVVGWFSRNSQPLEELSQPEVKCIKIKRNTFHARQNILFFAELHERKN